MGCEEREREKAKIKVTAKKIRHLKQAPLPSLVVEVQLQQDLQTLVALVEQAYSPEAPYLEGHNFEISCLDYCKTWQINAIIYVLQNIMLINQT